MITQTYANGAFPPLVLPGGESIKHVHPEWAAHRTKWRWLLDSYEGGDAYRYAQYEPVGLAVSHSLAAGWGRRYTFNLVPHKREWEDDARSRVGDDYAMRLLRTPVPTFMPEAVDKHLGKIFNQAIKRKGPKSLMAWWGDVDRAGSDIGHVVSSSLAPLLMVFGCLDICIEPAAAKGEVRSQADVLAQKLTSPRLSYVLPQNVPWWRLDDIGNYTEILIVENVEGGTRFLYWGADRWARYDDRGNEIKSDEHGIGRVPVFRAFDDPKRPRCRNVAMPRYEAIAELQREYYNRDSELILSDTTQAHPLIQGPEDYVKDDGSIPIGPSWLLPKKKNSNGGAASYEGFDVIGFPKDGAESLRRNKADIRDDADRASCLSKPAGGSDGTSGDAIGQSGVSKRIDQSEGNELLGEIADVLQRLEVKIAEFALDVMGEAVAKGRVKVEYPKKFDLFSLDEFMGFAERFQGVAATAGNLPETESMILSKAVRMGFPGLDESDYKAADAEIEKYVKDRAAAGDDGRAEDAEAMLRKLAAKDQPAAASGGEPDAIEPSEETE